MNLQDKKETPDWRKQQDIIAKFLEDNSFEVWIERGIKNRRIDVLAKRSYKNKTYYIIFEVKHYNNVTAGVEDKFFEQLSDYVQLFILRELKRRSFEHVSKKPYVGLMLIFISSEFILGIFTPIILSCSKDISPTSLVSCNTSSTFFSPIII